MRLVLGVMDREDGEAMGDACVYAGAKWWVALVLLKPVNLQFAPLMICRIGCVSSTQLRSERWWLGRQACAVSTASRVRAPASQPNNAVIVQQRFGRQPCHLPFTSTSLSRTQAPSGADMGFSITATSKTEASGGAPGCPTSSATRAVGSFSLALHLPCFLSPPFESQHD